MSHDILTLSNVYVEIEMFTTKKKKNSDDDVANSSIMLRRNRTSDTNVSYAFYVFNVHGMVTYYNFTCKQMKLFFSLFLQPEHEDR